jgi:hypothetical protein
MSPAYRNYHSGIKLQYANGKLQFDVTNSIPRSTKQDGRVRIFNPSEHLSFKGEPFRGRPSALVEKRKCKVESSDKVPVLSGLDL